MLNPNSRSLYTSAMTPPPGMIFDEAVATTNTATLEADPTWAALLAHLDRCARAGDGGGGAH